MGRVAGGEVTTWAALDARVETLARLLLGSLGLRRGDRVALLALNHPSFFEIAFACWRAGLVLAPINWRLAAPEVAALLELAEPRLLLVDAHGGGLLAAMEREPGCRSLTLDALYGFFGQPAPETSFALEPSAMEDPALLLFTSGTTGRPKAAVLPVRQLFWNAVNTALAFGLTRGDATLLYTPLFHTGAINVLAMPLFFVGGSVWLREGFDAEAIPGELAAHGITTVFGVPTTFQMMLESAAFGRADLSRLRLCLCGGAPLPVSLIHAFQARGLTLTQGFGMTEVGPNCFYLPPEQALLRAGSVGRPMPYASARVVVGGREAAPGEVGELLLSGPHVCQGYFRNPAATAMAMEEGWFRTGDLARTDEDGYFYVAGRAKDMFISGGENVYPAEVEVALAAHPDVLECAVVPMPDPRWGEVGCAFVVFRHEDADPDALKRFLRARLAAYKVPRRFVKEASLPRNPSGKVVKEALVARARALAPAER
jgi:fatty-acyl-CoA synthase